MITSRANARVKAARALGEAKERKRTGLFVDEGEDALRAALAAGIAPVEAFVDDDLGSDRIADELAAAGAKVLRCSAEVMAALSTLSHTSRAVGVFRANDLPPLAAARRPARSACTCTACRIPATSARCCAAPRASGPAHVALAEGCADPLSPRAVRASMGASTTVPVITLPEAPALPVIALDARAERTLAELAPSAPVAFALGGERTGLPPDMHRRRRRRGPHPAGRRRGVAERGDRGRAGALRAAPLIATQGIHMGSDPHRRSPGLVWIARRRRPGRPSGRERLAFEARVRRAHGQARLGAERSPLVRAAPFQRHRDDAAREADVELEAAFGGVPQRVLADALAARDPAVVRGADVGGAGLEDVEHELPVRPRAATRRRVRARRRSSSPAEVHERAKGRQHAVARRQRRRVAQVAEHGLDQVADAVGGCARRSAWASIAGAASSAITRWPCRASSTAMRPLPAPSSMIGPAAPSQAST